MTNIQELRAQVQALKAEVEEAKVSISDANDLFTTYLALARRSGLPENMIEAAVHIQRVRIAMQMLYRAANLLFLTSSPVGWAIGLGQLAVGGIMLYDTMQIRRPRY